MRPSLAFAGGEVLASLMTLVMRGKPSHIPSVDGTGTVVLVTIVTKWA